MFDEPEELVGFIEEHGGYWDGEHPNYPKKDWRLEVQNNDTLLSYWEWVFSKVEGDD
jgi:hypothetical protein